MISPEAWKTPAKHDEVISRSSLENGSKDSELSWGGTALEDGSKFVSCVRNELESPDLEKIDCAEAVMERMTWEGFQDLKKIGMEDPPDVAEDNDVLERDWGKIEKNLNERQGKLRIAKRMNSEKILKRNRRLKPHRKRKNFGSEEKNL